MMRNGRILAEDSPASLIESYKQSSLENVFLSLCMQNGDTDKSSRASPDNLDEVVTDETDGKSVEEQSSVENVVTNYEEVAAEYVQMKDGISNHVGGKDAFENNSHAPCYNVLISGTG